MLLSASLINIWQCTEIEISGSGQLTSQVFVYEGVEISHFPLKGKGRKNTYFYKDKKEEETTNWTLINVEKYWFER